jgi:hypothetical protein
MTSWNPEISPAVSQLSTRPVVILHAFDKSLQQIIDRLAEFQLLGCSHVQTSPITQTYPSSLSDPKWNKRITDNLPASNNPWWLGYQPSLVRAYETDWSQQSPYTLIMTSDGQVRSGFKIGNSYGSQAQLIQLTTLATSLKMKVVMDVAPNQIASTYNFSPYQNDYENNTQFIQDLNADQSDLISTSGVPPIEISTNIPSYYFHSNTDGIYTDQWFPPYPQDTLPDLNTSHQDVLIMIAEYWINLLNCGITGFRVDGLKQMSSVDVRRMFRMIEYLRVNPNNNTTIKGIDFYNPSTPSGYIHDTFILNANSVAPNVGSSLFVYGETIDIPSSGLGDYQAYKGIMPQTDYILASTIHTALLFGGNISSLLVPKTIGDRDAITFGISHDFHAYSFLDTAPSMYKTNSDLITYYPHPLLNRFQVNSWNGNYNGASDSYWMQYTPDNAINSFIACSYVLTKSQGIPLVLWQDITLSPMVRAAIYFRNALRVFMSSDTTLNVDPLLGYLEWCSIPTVSSPFPTGCLLVGFRGRGIYILNKSSSNWTLNSNANLNCPFSSGAGPIGGSSTFVDITNASNNFSLNYNSSNNLILKGTAIAAARSVTFFLDTTMLKLGLLSTIATFTIDHTGAQPSSMPHVTSVIPSSTSASVTVSWDGLSTPLSMNTDNWIMKQPVFSSSDLSDNISGQQWQLFTKISSGTTSLNNITFKSSVKGNKTFPSKSVSVPTYSCLIDIHDSF